MTPQDIRTLRGSLSQAAFARQLSVTPLTVHRWELPEGNKEARRPRGRILERLQRLVAGGPSSTREEEPRSPSSAPLSMSPAPDPDFEKEQEIVLPLLEQISTQTWAQAEERMLDLLERRALASSGGRALASLGVAFAQLVMWLDVRAARTAWAPVAEAAECGTLPNSVAARTFVLGALIFSTRDNRSFDPARTAGYIARAEALLGEGDVDQRVLLLRARIAAARHSDTLVALDAYRAHASSIDDARSPLAQFTVVTLREFAAHATGDEEAAGRYLATARSMAHHLGLDGFFITLLADRIERLIRGAYPLAAVLETAREVRELMTSARLPMTESYLFVLGVEIEAYFRSARVAEAEAVATEALASGRHGSFAFAISVLHHYTAAARVPELPALADRLDTGGGGVHVALIRGYHALLTSEPERAARLADEVCSAPPETVGLPYALHQAYAQLVAARLLLRDVEGAAAALQRTDAHLREQPSVWYSAMSMRQRGYLLLQQGRLAEARQKLQAATATFALTGDVLQPLLARFNLATLGIAAGSPGAYEEQQQVLGEVAQRQLTIAPEFQRFTADIVAPGGGARLQEASLMERVLVAVERLSVRGLEPAQIMRELASILKAVFPGRELSVDGEDTVEFGASGRFGVRGPLDSEERAALQILATVVPILTLDAAAVSDEEIAVDAVLPGFVAAAPATRRLKAEVAQLARSSATILVDGESGSGKEVVARAVHDLSTRSERPYVVFNCASVPRDLFESQLFGHRRGSFTGATSDNLGVIREAEGGTLFLDEIGELSLEMQPKLLRFLENGEVLAVGETKPRRVDVRVIAATHRDLQAFVREGRFRQDLFYRLNVVPLRVPPLRDRKEDVLALARLFIARLAPEGSEPPQLAQDAVAALMAHRWPGNVRELRNMVERALAYTPVPRILHATDLRLANG